MYSQQREGTVPPSKPLIRHWGSCALSECSWVRINTSSGTTQGMKIITSYPWKVTDLNVQRYFYKYIYDWWTLYVHTCSRCNHHIYPIYIRGRKTNREGFLLLTRVLFSYLNIFFNYIYTYLNTIGKLRIYSYLNCTQMRHSIGKMINDMWFKVDIYLNKYISLESSTILYVLHIWVRYGRGRNKLNSELCKNHYNYICNWDFWLFFDYIYEQTDQKVQRYLSV